MVSRSPTGPQLRGRSPVDCAASRPSYACSASRSPSVARVTPVAGSSEYVGSPKKTSAPSAMVSKIEQDQDTQRQDRNATLHAAARSDPERSRPRRFRSPLLTVLTPLTVLLQCAAFRQTRKTFPSE